MRDGTPGVPTTAAVPADASTRHRPYGKGHPHDEPRAHKKARTVENQGLRGSGAFTLPMRTGTPTSTSVDVCPRCGGVLTREHRSWTCEDCRFVPNHGAD